MRYTLKITGKNVDIEHFVQEGENDDTIEKLNGFYKKALPNAKVKIIFDSLKRELKN